MKQIFMVDVNGNQKVNRLIDAQGYFSSNQQALDELFPGVSRKVQEKMLVVAESDFYDDLEISQMEQEAEFFLMGTRGL